MHAVVAFLVLTTAPAHDMNAFWRTQIRLYWHFGLHSPTPFPSCTLHSHVLVLSLPNCTTLSLHPCSRSPSVRGTVAGMVGMAVAIVATLYLPQFAGGSADYNFTKFFLPLGAGAALGTVMAARVEMMEMPELGMQRDTRDESAYYAG